MDARTRAMGELRATLGTIGWTKVIRPSLEAEILQTLDGLARPGVKNVPEGWTKEEFNAFLSGRVDALKYVLTTFQKKLEEYEQEQLQAQIAQAPPEPVGSPYESANPTQEG